MADTRMKHTILTGIFAALVTAFPSVLPGADAPEAVGESPEGGPDPSEVFAYQGGVVLTQQELDAAFSAIPEAQRLAFIRDGGKVDQLVKTLLRRKSVAADAERADYEEQAPVAESHESAVQRSPSSQARAWGWLTHWPSGVRRSSVQGLPSSQAASVPLQTPFAQTSPLVHASPSSQGRLLGSFRQPCVGWHQSVVQRLPSSHSSVPVETHAPSTH